jgi:CBS domain-containing protein
MNSIAISILKNQTFFEILSELKYFSEFKFKFCDDFESYKNELKKDHIIIFFLTEKNIEDFDYVVKNKIPFIDENSSMKKALSIITQKKLGTLIVRDSNKNTSGIITDGQIRLINQKSQNLHDLSVKQVMTKNPIKVDKDTLAMKALSIMNDNKISSLCVKNSSNKNKTIGIIHIHNILANNIN